MSRRSSPLSMGLRPDRVMEQNGWKIVLTYLGEKTYNPFFITDLSHVPKWTLQGRNLDVIRPAGLTVPAEPNSVIFDGGVLIARLSFLECRIMVLEKALTEFASPQYSEVTDAYAAFAIVGPQCLEVLSKLSPVDLDEPGQAFPHTAQAPVEDVTCLIVRLHGKNNIPGLIISGARGYGHFLLEIFMDAGKEYGLAPVGWERFKNWLNPGK